MNQGSVTIGGTVRAGYAGLGANLRACWVALSAAALLSLVASLLPSPVSILAEAAAATLAYGSLYRHAFARTPGWRGLRWGLDEWRVLAAHLLIGVVLLIVAAVLVVVVVGVGFGVARTHAPGFDATSPEAWRTALAAPSGALVVVVLALALAFLTWLGLRLSLAPAASVAQGRLQVLGAFGLTRGAVAPLLVGLLVLIAPAVAASLVAGAGGALISDSSVLVEAVTAAVLYLYFAPAWVGALVHVYERRRATAPVAGNA